MVTVLQVLFEYWLVHLDNYCYFMGRTKQEKKQEKNPKKISQGAHNMFYICLLCICLAQQQQWNIMSCVILAQAVVQGLWSAQS